MIANRNNKILYPRGSEWRKWDLHIHSDCSRGSLEQIVDRVIEKGISVFSITDHSSVKNIDSFLEIVKRKQRENKDVYFLPGVELRTDKGKRSVHLIGIFPLKDKDEAPINSDYLKQNLLSKIDCSDTDIINAGKEVLGKGKTTRDYRKRGLLEITVNFERVAKKINELGGITIVHAGTKSSGLEKEMYHPRSDNSKELYNSLGHTKRNLMEKYIDVCELPNWHEPNLKERDFYLKKFNKPSIVSSDSHKLSDIGERYTWIKADPTFEGLKQIIYEPEERVYIGDEDPRKFIHSWLESFEVEDDFSAKFFINQNTPILFNPALNVLIGSRGAGKSVLLDSLILSTNQLKINPDSYVATFLAKNKKSTLACRVGTEGGFTGQLVQYKWKGKVEGEEQIERFPCDYFSQKKIGRIAEGRVEKEKVVLSDFIFEHIFTKFAKDALEKMEDAKSKTLSDLELNRRDIINQENLISKEREVVKKLADLKKQEKSYSQKGLKELYDKRSQIIKLQDALLESISSIDVKIKEYEDFLKRFNISSIKEIGKIFEVGFVNKELGKVFKKNFSQIISDLKTSIEIPPSKLSKIQKLLKSYSQTLKLDEWYEKIRKEIRNKSQELGIEFSEELDKKIHKIQGQIVELELEKERIAKAKQQKKELIKQREELLDMYLKQLNTTEELLRKAFDSFCKQDGSVLRGSIGIDFYKDVSNEDYIEVIRRRTKLLDTEKSRKFPRPQLQKIFEKEQNIQNVINKFRKKNFKPWAEIKDVGNATVDYLKAIENTEEIAIFLEEILPSLRVTILWRDRRGNYKPLSECSVGERSTAVLSIVLVSGKTPLLIDQPEDDLDNFYIFERLVPIIKTVKRRRQLIFVTHDANIVVNADAELILILKSPDGKHAEIESATIENMEKRNDVITILEGGAKAFARREQRLRGPT